MEINNDINEIVYMKRDIKSHRIYEKHPNLMFGIIILVWGLLFFFGCFSDVYWVYWMVLVIIIVPITIWYIKNNEKTNLTKSSAFIAIELIPKRVTSRLSKNWLGLWFGSKNSPWIFSVWFFIVNYLPFRKIVEYI